MISGVGLARYLDAEKDAAKFAPCPRWAGRAPTAAATSSAPRRPGCCSWGAPTSRSSSAGGASSWVRSTPRCSLSGVRGAAAAVRRTRPATRCWWGTSCPTALSTELDTDAAVHALREQLPAALVPLLAVVDDLPTRTSGKVDRDALPWPLPGGEREVDPVAAGLLTPTEGNWPRAGRRSSAWRCPTRRPTSSPTAAAASPPRSWWRIRTRHPQVSVNDVYLHGRSRRLDALGATRTGGATSRRRRAAPRSRRPCSWPRCWRWSACAGRASPRRSRRSPPSRFPGRTRLADSAVVVARLAWLVLFSPAGRIGIAAGGALLLRGVRPGQPPARRLGARALWAATRLAELSGATGVSAASWTTRYARALGAKIGNDVDLHSAPPVTGLLKVGRGAAVAPEVDLGGYWVDGDVVHIGRSGSAPGPRRLAQLRCCRARGSARAPRSRRGPRSRGGPRRSALGGLARGADRQVGRVLAVDPPVALALLAARLRRHVDAARAAARGGGAACARDRRGRRRGTASPRRRRAGRC